MRDRILQVVDREKGDQQCDSRHDTEAGRTLVILPVAFVIVWWWAPIHIKMGDGSVTMSCETPPRSLSQ